MKFQGVLSLTWLGLLAVMFLITSPAQACSYCNVHNHLGTAAKTCGLLAIGEVVNVTPSRDVNLRIKEVLIGKQPPGPETVYDNILGIDLKAGDQVIIIDEGMSLVVSRAALPMSLMPEIQALREERSPKNTNEAVGFLTAISTELHSTGGAYYRTYPFEVQEQLASWIQSNQIDPARSYSFEKNQYLFGLSALLRGPREGAVEAAIRIMDEFWQLPETAAPEDRQWTLTKLTLVFDMIAGAILQDLADEIVKMVQSATPSQLIDLTQCLILSNLKTPEQIATLRGSDEDLQKLKEAALLAAWRHESYWNRDTAKLLLESIRKLPGPQNPAQLNELEAALSASDTPITLRSKRPSLAATPLGPGWAIESILFYHGWWDELTPYQPKSTALWWWIAPCLLVAGLAGYMAWRRFNTIALR